MFISFLHQVLDLKKPSRVKEFHFKQTSFMIDSSLRRIKQCISLSNRFVFISMDSVYFITDVYICILSAGKIRAQIHSSFFFANVSNFIAIFWIKTSLLILSFLYPIHPTYNRYILSCCIISFLNFLSIFLGTRWNTNR